MWVSTELPAPHLRDTPYRRYGGFTTNARPYALSVTFLATICARITSSAASKHCV
jgi:hypothetical protein